MTPLSIIRISVFIIAILLAVVALAFAGRWLYKGSYILFNVSGSLTIVIMLLYIVVDIKRKGAFTSMVFVELITITVLWILWLSASAVVLSLDSMYCWDNYCEFYDVHAHAKLSAAIAFLSFLNLFIYSIILSVFTFIAQRRGHKPWMRSVKYTNFLAPKVPAKDPAIIMRDEPSRSGSTPQDTTKSQQTTPPAVPNSNNVVPHPGFPEPQSNESPGLRNVTSIVGIDDSTPFLQYQDTNRWIHSPSPQQPVLLPYGGAPVHPGFPEPHLTLSPGLRHVSSNVGGVVSGSEDMPAMYHWGPPHPNPNAAVGTPELRSVGSNLSTTINESLTAQHPSSPQPPLYPMV